MVWTDERISRWQDTGELPSPVMDWTPAPTGAFLDHVHRVADRLYPLYHLIALGGLCRGEACGVHWDDLDLDNNTLTVGWQLVQHGWATTLDTPKTDDSDAVIALDTITIAVLCAHRTTQRRERLAAGPARTGSRLVFTTPSGVDRCTPQTSPITSTSWPPKPDYHQSGYTTCATAQPPSPPTST
jgi:integrase